MRLPDQSSLHLFVSCICLLLQLSPTILCDHPAIGHIDYPGIFIRAKVNNGALDANGAGNYTWQWVTLNNSTPPFKWLKWRFDSTLLKVGPPPYLETGDTEQVCLECNGWSANCDITVIACHGDRNQQWRKGIVSRHAEMTFNDTHNRRYFSIFSELHPERCITLAGTLTTTYSYMEMDPATRYYRTEYVQMNETISGLGYNLEMCTGSDEQTFYIEEVNF